MTKPLTLWSVTTGPNPWKVAIVLVELGIPYETKFLTMPEMKQKPYTDLNPNGRVPCIEDPNTGVKLWETAAIILYLQETYDKENRLQYTTSPEKYEQLQWLAFQVSGQGPYFGQAGWFTMFHPEKIPSAIERYQKETLRVVGVLDNFLSTKQAPYLVGDRCTFADLSFITWNVSIGFFFEKGGATFDDTQFPHFKKWHDGLLARPAVGKVLGEMQEEMTKRYGQG